MTDPLLRQKLIEAWSNLGVHEDRVARLAEDLKRSATVLAESRAEALRLEEQWYTAGPPKSWEREEIV